MVNRTVRDREQANKKKDRQNEKEQLISITELFKLVVIQCGVCSLEYFLDKMKPYELSIICDSLHLRNKDSWEQARMIAYIMAQVNSTKKLKPTDIIKFGWENTDESTTPNKPLTKEDVEKIKAIALQREKELKKLGII